MRRFCVVVTRVGRRWRIDIPELQVHTAARFLAEIEPIARRKVRRTTIVDPQGIRARDLVLRQFNPPAPNRLWVADMTYVSTWSGFVHAAFVVDAYSRRIVGWRTSTSMTSSLVLDAIEHAIWTRQRDGIGDLHGLVQHHDYAEVCVKPRMRGDGLARSGVPADFSA